MIEHLVSNDLLAGDAEPGSQGWGFWGQSWPSPGFCPQSSPSGRDKGGPRGGASFPRCAPHLFCGEKRYRAQGSRLRQHPGLCGSSTFCSREQQLWGGGVVFRAPPSLTNPSPCHLQAQPCPPTQAPGQGATLGSRGPVSGHRQIPTQVAPSSPGQWGAQLRRHFPSPCRHLTA